MLKKLFKTLFVLLGLTSFSALLLAVIYWLQVRKVNGEIVTSGEKRAYLLHVPPTYRPGTLTPLVISIHGYAEWPAHQMEISRWDALADQEGFIVVYPLGDGIPPHWSLKGQVDTAREVRFISDLIDKLEKEYTIDAARVYANGLSNGGGLSFVLSCRLSDRIAAIGSVSGAYLLPWDDCAPTHAVPTIAFHGTQDPIVPFTGGRSASFNEPFPDVSNWIQTLAARYGCSAEAQIEQISASISKSTYQNCAQNTEVVFYMIAGGGHAWPGGPALPKWIVGHTNTEIDATPLMWEFFKRHPLGS